MIKSTSLLLKFLSIANGLIVFYSMTFCLRQTVKETKLAYYLRFSTQYGRFSVFFLSPYKNAKVSYVISDFGAFLIAFLSTFIYGFIADG